MKNKFTKITVIALTILIALASVSLGKVFAYFGSKSSASGSITMGTLSIGDVKTSDGTSIDWDIGNLQPNQSFGGSYKVEVNSNINYYIRILFKASVTPQSGSTHINGTSCGDYVTDDTDILSISIDGTTTGTYQKSTAKTGDGYTPYYRLSPTKVTSDTTTETFNIDLKVNDWVGCNYCHYYMKADVVVNMRVQVLQADYLESNNEGVTVSSVSEMHSLWSTIMAHTVTLTNNIVASGISNIVYYAVDGETTWHELSNGSTIKIGVASRIALTIDNSMAVDWDTVNNTTIYPVHWVVVDYGGEIYYLYGRRQRGNYYQAVFNISNNCEMSVYYDNEGS